LFCDDLQWGDADSAEAMHDVLDGLETPKLLFIGCYRQDEAEQSSFLRSWNQYQAQYADTSRSVKLEVGSLTVEHCIELIRQRAYSQDDNLCRRLGKELFEETGGNAFILHELLECIDQEKLSLRRIPLRQVIAQKLSALPPQASSVLIAVAVSGKAMTAPMVGEVTETGEAVYTLLTTMRNARLIRFIGEDDDLRIDTYHDKIRESVLESLDQNVLRAMHRRLMEVIENAKTTSNAYIYDLAYHADACGDPAKARKYSLLAARLAREQLAPQVAVQQYEISLRHSITDLCNPGNYELAEGYASSLLLVGRYHDAQEILKNAQGCSETTLQRVRLEELSGLASFKLGNLHASLSHFHQALSLLEEPTPKWLVGKLLSIAKVYATNQLRSLRRWQSGPPPSEIARASTRILTQMAKSAAFSDGLMMVWCALRGISIAERYQPTSDLAFCYIIYASAAAAVGQHRISLNYAKKGLELYSELNDEWGEGHSLTWSGINAFARGDYLKAIDSLELGVKILERVGDEWDINIGMFHLACSLYQLGRLDTAIETAYEVFERSVRYGDTRTNCALYLLAKASDGRADLTSYLKRRLDAPEDILATCNFHKCLGIKLIAEEKFPEAVHETNIACDLPLRHRLPNYHSVAGVPLAVAARRRHAESLELGSKVRRAALTKARSLASRALWICSLYPPEYPAALREYAEVSRIAGKTNRAIKYFDKSIRNAEQQSASYEAAKARLGKAQLLVQLKEPGAEKFLTAANEEMSSFCELIAKGLASINNPTNSSTR
jgi:tetratricopeptide (TPR) repeat protein